MTEMNGYAIALGMFDGLHLGHRRLIGEMVHFAKNNGMYSMVFTFENHPLSVFGKETDTLMTVPERIAVMKELGVEKIVMIPFDRAFAAQPPNLFLDKMIAGYGMRAAFAGFNYTFGDKGMGNTDFLCEYAKSHGFSAQILPPVLYLGEPVSSSRIRAAISDGRMADANAMLGDTPYSVAGLITKDSDKLYFEPETLKALPKTGDYCVELSGEDFKVSAQAVIQEKNGKKVIGLSTETEIPMGISRLFFLS